MSLPAPDLDDRRFQELVDDAKRMVQQRCPEWTDHNVSDPGVTLIELFAWMTDQVVYRLNRVPDRAYVKFLELLGVELYPATAARAGVTFWLSAAQPEPVVIPAGVDVATASESVEDEVTFTTTDELEIVPCSLERIATRAADGEPYDQSQILSGGEPFHCFQQPPEPGDVLLFGLSDPVPSCAVVLRVDCVIEGVGVDPDDPPLVWEAWDGEGWVRCDVERDTSGGLNRAGEVVVHVPASHEASLIDDRRAGWIRCRTLEARGGQHPYSSSPRILDASAFTIGGTASAVNAEIVLDEMLGFCEGIAGESFELDRSPVVPGDRPVVVEVAGEDGWETWEQVEDFSESGPEDRHIVLDAATGQVRFGPAVRNPDGSLRHYGAVPPSGAAVRVPEYRAGGGRRGNVSAGALSILRTSIPLVAEVNNRRPATGGVDNESLDNAKVRGPMLLRTRNRAVTYEDFEVLAREAAPEVARVRCVGAGADDGEAAGVRVLVVPHAGAPDQGLAFEDLVPADETLQRIAAFLDERRPVGARVVVEPPAYQGVTVVARLGSRPNADAQQVEAAARAALHAYFNPLHGGPDGQGWPFGRPVHVGEVYATLQGLDGTALVEDARLFAADPITGERGDQVERIEIDASALVFSYEHQVRVEEA